MILPAVFTAEAREDLRSILNYVADESITMALRLIDRLEDESEAIGDSPLRYPLVPGHEESNVRRKVVGSYNVYYWIRRDRVEILHILHGARDHERILFSED